MLSIYLQNCQPDKQALSNSSQDYSLQQSELWNIAKLSQYQQEKLPKWSAYPSHPSNPWPILMSSSHSLCPSYRTRKLQHCLPAQTVGYHAGDCPLLSSSDIWTREIWRTKTTNPKYSIQDLISVFSILRQIMSADTLPKLHKLNFLKLSCICWTNSKIFCWLDSLFINPMSTPVKTFYIWLYIAIKFQLQS